MHALEDEVADASKALSIHPELGFASKLGTRPCRKLVLWRTDYALFYVVRPRLRVIQIIGIRYGGRAPLR